MHQQINRGELIYMRIFGKERQSLVISKLRAVKGTYSTHREVVEVQIEMLTEDNERLTLQLNPNLLPSLIGELTDIYEAINPPLNRRNNGVAGWDGAGL